MKDSRFYKAALKEMKSKKPNHAKAFKLLQKALDAGDGSAAYALATWYLFGTYVEKSVIKAVRLLRVATKENVAEAFYDLAICYEKGAGVKKNPKKAYENYLQGAIWGDKQAMFEVGRCLLYGIGTERNKMIGESWLKRSESLGYRRDS